LARRLTIWLNKLNIPHNNYFIIPALIWVVVGGILLATVPRYDLFIFINSRHSPILDTIMFRATLMGQAEVIVPVLLLLMAVPTYRNKWFITTTVLCNLTPLIISRLMKSFFDSPRPVKYFDHATWIHVNPDWPVFLQFSFPSGHSEGAFAFFCFLSLVIPPDYKRYGALFFVLACFVAYSRVYLAAHFFADIYVGSMIGFVSCTLMYAVMYKYKWKFIKEKDTFA
jgi:membrane-associated phospholipid phosphatase